MKVLLCKFRCPFICFCKPSSTLYTPGPLKLEDSPHVPSTGEIIPNSNEHHVSGDSLQAKEESTNRDMVAQNGLKTSIKNSALNSKETEKKRVQWMDFLGKQLVEIREFESSEAEDSDSDEQSNRHCMCIIL